MEEKNIANDEPLFFAAISKAAGFVRLGEVAWEPQARFSMNGGERLGVAYKIPELDVDDFDYPTVVLQSRVETPDYIYTMAETPANALGALYGILKPEAEALRRKLNALENGLTGLELCQSNLTAEGAGA